MTITELHQVRASPLMWPEAKSRTSQRKTAPFGDRSMATALREIEDEMRKWGIKNFIVSMDPAHLRGAADPGVAVWFAVRRRDRPSELRVLACDTFHRRELNLHALAVTLHDLRRIERYGTYSTDQATEGMRPALPAPSDPAERKWWDVLGVASNWPLEAIEIKYQQLAKRAHPDSGGSGQAMAELNCAIETARKELTT